MDSLDDTDAPLVQLRRLTATGRRAKDVRRNAFVIVQNLRALGIAVDDDECVPYYAGYEGGWSFFEKCRELPLRRDQYGVERLPVAGGFGIDWSEQHLRVLRLVPRFFPTPDAGLDAPLVEKHRTGVNLVLRDFFCLGPTEWLTDNAIDYFLRLFVEKCTRGSNFVMMLSATAVFNYLKTWVREGGEQATVKATRFANRMRTDFPSVATPTVLLFPFNPPLDIEWKRAGNHWVVDCADLEERRVFC